MPQAVFAEDPRRPVERLRRSQLWRVAEHHNITYPKDATKDVMISILDGAGVDVTRDESITWKTVSMKNDKDETVQQTYPEEPKRGGLDNAALSRIMRERAEKEEAEKAKLKEANTGLESQLEKAIGVIENLQNRLSALEEGSQEKKLTGVAYLNHLRRQCKAKGITYSRSDKTADLESKLSEAE